MAIGSDAVTPTPGPKAVNKWVTASVVDDAAEAQERRRVHESRYANEVILRAA
jgi:hypothetical protein